MSPKKRRGAVPTEIPQKPPLPIFREEDFISPSSLPEPEVPFSFKYNQLSLAHLFNLFPPEIKAISTLETFFDLAKCAVCHSFSRFEIKQSCKNCFLFFHTECFNRRIMHQPSELLKPNKLNCIQCLTPLTIKNPPESTGEQFYVSAETINSLDLTRHHKLCVNCTRVFPCGERSCFAVSETEEDPFENHCTDCGEKNPFAGTQTFECPECGNALQKLEGCDSLRCCKFGWYDCKKEECTDKKGNKHGSSQNVKFCGKTFSMKEAKFLRDDKKQIKVESEVESEAEIAISPPPPSVAMRKSKKPAPPLTPESESENSDDVKTRLEMMKKRRTVQVKSLSDSDTDESSGYSDSD